MTLPPAALALRGFAINFLTAHDLRAVERVMDPAYRLSIGGHRFDGRDGAYLPATAAQLDQFPGLVVTVHDVILGDGGCAMRFTEHGASVRDGGRIACWRGITLFQLAGGRLAEGWAEEDYFARKRQLKDGTPDAVAPPHLAPWDGPCRPHDPATEAVVRDWLARPDRLLHGAGTEAVMLGGPAFAALIEADALDLSHLLVAGDRAACHLTLRGRYAGGFPDLDPALAGAAVALPAAAMLDVADGRVVRAQVSADRLGLYRQLARQGA